MVRESLRQCSQVESPDSLLERLQRWQFYILISIRKSPLVLVVGIIIVDLSLEFLDALDAGNDWCDGLGGSGRHVVLKERK